ncbi:hypothetical protein L1987_51014 [Smallanthus sonchifolius]|uniref:Uncharacterized protein n=1 Tax=Smallanthus sonchifolius TaxID=185202 RepID=A0ACB9EQ81_9ASTR|nr:hypothetical protein L1987_51014 [Smallanthus sonchifolius]
MSWRTNLCLVLLALYVLETTSVPHQFHVRIHNDIEGVEYKLVTHCFSGDDDLGTHILKPNQERSWTFHDVIWPGKHSVFVCDFLWKNLYNRFEVINTGWPNMCDKLDKPGCRTYHWSVKSDGFYLAIGDNPVPSDYVFKDSWQGPRLNKWINV